MNAISCKNLKEDLDGAMQRVCEDHLPVVVTRDDAEPVVIISLEDYRSIEETMYLLSAPSNAARLARSLEQANSGKLVERNLIE